MPNPLNSGSALGGFSFTGMTRGETRTVTFKSGITKTITRTDRPFMFDWCDASNLELRAKGSNFEWRVTVSEDGAQEAKLVDPRYAPKQSQGRWKPSYEEFAEIHANMAKAVERGSDWRSA